LVIATFLGPVGALGATHLFADIGPHGVSAGKAGRGSAERSGEPKRTAHMTAIEISRPALAETPGKYAPRVTAQPPL